MSSIRTLIKIIICLGLIAFALKRFDISLPKRLEAPGLLACTGLGCKDLDAPSLRPPPKPILVQKTHGEKVQP